MAKQQEYKSELVTRACPHRPTAPTKQLRSSLSLHSAPLRPTRVQQTPRPHHLVQEPSNARTPPFLPRNARIACACEGVFGAALLRRQGQVLEVDLQEMPFFSTRFSERSPRVFWGGGGGGGERMRWIGGMDATGSRDNETGRSFGWSLE